MKAYAHQTCLANNIGTVPVACCRNIRWTRFISACKYRTECNKRPHLSNFIGINARNERKITHQYVSAPSGPEQKAGRFPAKAVMLTLDTNTIQNYLKPAVT